MNSTKKIRAKSRSRFEAREVERKVIPAIKLLSKHFHNTTAMAPAFRGYKVPAGDFSDNQGRNWQVQVVAVCTKKDRMKRNEVAPMIDKWAIGLRLRVWAKSVIDNLFE